MVYAGFVITWLEERVEGWDCRDPTQAKTGLDPDFLYAAPSFRFMGMTRPSAEDRARA
jgi:hypothetical protein